MRYLKLFLFSIPLLVMASVYAQYSYQAPTDDLNTNTGTFPLDDKIDRKADEKPLKMQREQEQETEVDSFGQDEFNENIDLDMLDDNDN